METGLVLNESPTEYFKNLVESAVAGQGLAVDEATTFYVVILLARYVRLGPADIENEEPIGVRYAKAMEAGGFPQKDGLRRVGDLSLFVSGFFSDSLKRSLVDVDYYICVGERAYKALALLSSSAFKSVYAQLGKNFSGFVDVLCEVSEHTALTSNTDLLRVYERWLKTRSTRTGELLARRGIVPNLCAGSRFVQ